MSFLDALHEIPRLIVVRIAVKLAAHYMNRKLFVDDGASRGSIICTASNVGLYPLPTSPLYSASKFGVVGLVRSLAEKLSGSNIQINALAPSLIGKPPYRCLSSLPFCHANITRNQHHWIRSQLFQADDLDPNADPHSGRRSAPCRCQYYWSGGRNPRRKCHHPATPRICGRDHQENNHPAWRCY